MRRLLAAVAAAVALSSACAPLPWHSGVPSHVCYQTVSGPAQCVAR